MFIKDDNMKPFDSKVWLSSPTMHGEELKYMTVPEPLLFILL